MPPRPLIGRRPSTGVGADRWVRRGSDRLPCVEAANYSAFGARLTIDVTHELRGRIKIAAFSRGSTVADLLREILQREFGEQSQKP